MKKYLLGIDIGTTGCKSTVYDFEGKKIAGDYREYFLKYPQPGWAEIDADTWWEAVVETIRGVSSKGIDLSEIQGIGISCTNSIMPVDREGNPLRRAIMQIDQRTGKEIDWLKGNIGEEQIFKVTGNRIAPGTFSAPVILWIKENEPEIYNRTFKFLVPTGYIVQKLTGNFTIDPSRASTTMLFDITKQEWDPDLTREMGVTIDKLPEIIPSYEIAGSVTEEASMITGLKSGTPVVTGCMDTVAAALGSGTVKNGDVFSILGTVGRLGICIDKPEFDNRFVNCCHGVPGTWLSMAAINGTGSSYRWFRDNFGQLESILANETGENSYEILNREAKKSPAGSRGVIYLPYLAAERSPIWDSDVCAAFIGLNISHKRADVIRSVLEGISYAFRHNLDIFKEQLGINIEDVIISGGGARSELWRQILADIMNVNLLLLGNKESETLGAAFLAGKGLGVYDDFNRLTPVIEDKKTPSTEQTKVYEEIYEVYRDLYLNLKDSFNRLGQIRNKYF